MHASFQTKLLRTLGVSPSKWTLLPSLAAALIAAPLLTGLGTLTALGCGGIVVHNRALAALEVGGGGLWLVVALVGGLVGLMVAGWWCSLLKIFAKKLAHENIIATIISMPHLHSLNYPPTQPNRPPTPPKFKPPKPLKPNQNQKRTRAGGLRVRAWRLGHLRRAGD
jgi:hypothetical protein